jgi:hypothetical protein
MGRKLPSFALTLGAAALALALSGCVDRRFVIDSDPPGANVYENGKLIGATPLNHSFTYYGKYRFVFVRDGYEWATVDEQVCTPWWSCFPLDFVVENLLPCSIRDVRYIAKPLEPRREIPAEQIRDRAAQLRAEGQQLVVQPVPGPQ